MYKARRKISLSLIFLMALGSSTALATSGASDEACNAEGYSELIIEPAKVETSTFTTVVFFQNMTNEKREFPARFDVMDAKAFEQLPSKISYEEEVCHDAVVESRSRDLPRGSISNFDTIKRADGTEYTRPIALSAHEIHKTRKEYFVESEAWIEVVSREIERPEPVVLANGKLRVLMTPSRQVGQCPIKLTKTVTQTYIKSRTPAVIEQKSCNAP